MHVHYAERGLIMPSALHIDSSGSPVDALRPFRCAMLPIRFFKEKIHESFWLAEKIQKIQKDSG